MEIALSSPSAFTFGVIIGYAIGFCATFSIWTYRAKRKIPSGTFAVVALLYVALGILIGERLSSELALISLAGAVVGFGLNTILVRLIQRLADWIAAKREQKRV